MTLGAHLIEPDGEARARGIRAPAHQGLISCRGGLRPHRNGTGTAAQNSGKGRVNQPAGAGPFTLFEAALTSSERVLAEPRAGGIWSRNRR